MPITIKKLDTEGFHSAVLEFQIRLVKSSAIYGRSGSTEPKKTAHYKGAINICEDLSIPRNEAQKAADAAIERYVTLNHRGLVVGWMMLKEKDGAMNIETICSHPEGYVSAGAALTMVNLAKARAMEKTGGRATLTDVSDGTGTSFYLKQDFKPVVKDASGNGTKMLFKPEDGSSEASPSSSTATSD